MKQGASTGIIRIAVPAVLLGVCLAVSLAGRSPHDDDWPVPDAAKQMKNPVPVSDAGMAAAKNLYSDHCERCHGDSGAGDGPDADMYDPLPASFADAHMMNMMTDGELFYKITKGRRPMPGFEKQLTDEQRWQLVNLTRSFAVPPKKDPPAAPVKKPAPAKH